MYYIITDGKDLFVARKHNKYLITKDETQATHFTDANKAKNVLANNVEYNGEKYVLFVKRIGDIDYNALDGSVAEWKEKFSQFTELIGLSKKRYNQLTDMLSVVDKEITDIEHYIEFNSLNAYQGYLSYKLLREKMTARRKIKDEMTIIFTISEKKVCNLTSDNLNIVFNSLDNRSYNPRIMEELFDNKGVVGCSEKSEEPG